MRIHFMRKMGSLNHAAILIKINVKTYQFKHSFKDDQIIHLKLQISNLLVDTDLYIRSQHRTMRKVEFTRPINIVMYIDRLRSCHRVVYFFSGVTVA
jgi:hypothetical protein